MPIDAIKYFGEIDTINPATGEKSPKVVAEIYEIPSALATGLSRIVLGMIPNKDNFQGMDIEIVNPATGVVESVLTPSRLTSFPIVLLPSPTQAFLVDQDLYNSVLWISPVHAGKYIRVTGKFDTCTVNGEWMQIVQGDFMSLQALGQDVSLPKGSWFLCNGSTPVNRFLFPKYYEHMKLKGFPYGQDSAGNPYTPDLRGRILTGVGQSETGLATLGQVMKTYTIPAISAPHNPHVHFGKYGGEESGNNINLAVVGFSANNERIDSDAVYASTSIANSNAPKEQWRLGYGINTGMFNIGRKPFQEHMGVNFYIKVV